MKKTTRFAYAILAAGIALAGCSRSAGSAQKPLQGPEEFFGPLFSKVMDTDALFGEGRLFTESKTFVDCVAKAPADSIRAAFDREAPESAEELEAFITRWFEVPSSTTADFSDSSDIDTHIRKLWKVLRREADSAAGESTLIPLRHGYVVPGGRFREVYYWDSYFTMLGLRADGEVESISDMVANFAQLIDEVGFIPNGNRTYYLGRSQPPYFSYMVELLDGIDGDAAALYQPELLKEYWFWMAGRHAVTLPDGGVLNRYCDAFSTPREEAYRDDIVTLTRFQAANPSVTPEGLFRDLRSAAESGWDFSSRWMRDFQHLHTIHTTDIIPVDLNCLLYHLETMLASGEDGEAADGRSAGAEGDAEGAGATGDKAAEAEGGRSDAQGFTEAAEARRKAIIDCCWDAEAGWFMDYDSVAGRRTGHLSLAGMYPLFAGIATPEQAALVAARFEKDFLKAGGAVTTLLATGEQWDAPNGWAPLQWISYVGLKNYGYDSLADELRTRWMTMVENVYAQNFKLLEKYDVIRASNTGGGEYANQDGFGWTNGVYRAMKTADSDK